VSTGRVSPGVSEGLVVAGLPQLGAGGAGVDVVAQQVVGGLGRVPLDEHGGLGVPGGHHLARCRGNTWHTEQANTR